MNSNDPAPDGARGAFIVGLFMVMSSFGALAEQSFPGFAFTFLWLASILCFLITVIIIKKDQ